MAIFHALPEVPAQTKTKDQMSTYVVFRATHLGGMACVPVSVWAGKARSRPDAVRRARKDLPELKGQDLTASKL